MLIGYENALSINRVTELFFLNMTCIKKNDNDNLNLSATF